MDTRGGPLHDDSEIIGFKPEHWHVDYRFLLKKYTQREEFGYPGGEVFNIPVSSIIPEPYDAEYLYGESMFIPTAREKGIDPTGTFASSKSSARPNTRRTSSMT